MTATAVIALAGVVVAVPPGAAGAEALPMQVEPAAGPWFTDVTVAGTGCKAAAGTDLLVGGALYLASAQPDRSFGRFGTKPAPDGSWSVQVVVIHSGSDDMGNPVPATPGAYLFMGTCGPVDDSGESPHPGEPAVATYSGAFEILPGGPTPVMTPSATTVTITNGQAPLSASGDLCRRPDGTSEGLVVLDGPQGVDQEDRSVSYHAGFMFTAASDGTWSGTLEPWPGSIPKPGVYQLRGECWLGEHAQQSGNGFGYGPMAITLVAGGQQATPTPATPATPVPAAPTFTG